MSAQSAHQHAGEELQAQPQRGPPPQQPGAVGRTEFGYALGEKAICSFSFS